VQAPDWKTLNVDRDMVSAGKVCIPKVARGKVLAAGDRDPRWLQYSGDRLLWRPETNRRIRVQRRIVELKANHADGDSPAILEQRHPTTEELGSAADVSLR
jgi:hypothetical protein